MAEHTPTPWKVTVDGRAGEIIRAADSTGRPIASMWINGDDMAGNAALIVRAVNSHEALVKALEVLLSEAESFSVSGVYFSEDCMGHKGPALARAALASAHSQEG